MGTDRVLLAITAATYAGSTGALAYTLGGWGGALVVMVASALPGGYLLRKHLERAEIERTRAKHAPERWQAPAQGGPAPEPLTLPPPQ